MIILIKHNENNSPFSFLFSTIDEKRSPRPEKILLPFSDILLFNEGNIFFIFSLI